MPDATITTLAELPAYVAGRYPKPALLGRCTSTGVTRYSTREVFDWVRDISLGLTALGVHAGDRVALVADSRPEWVIADLATVTAGAVTVPIYPTLPADQVGYILGDAGVTVAIVSDAEQRAKVLKAWSGLPTLRTLVVMDDAGEPSSDDRELTFASLAEQGHQRLMQADGLAREYAETTRSIPPDQLATIIYTSGTTGDPKGVMLTHGAVVANLVDVDTMITATQDDEALSFLPLCHALERTVVFLYLFKGVTITFAESVDTVGRDLAQIRPTLMTGVPRVYEKLHARVLHTVSQAPAIRQAIFRWALGVGHAKADAELKGQRPSLAVRLQHPLAERLVFATIRERTGGRLRFVVSGGAPLPVSVARFLFAVGLPVLEGYGLTETAPVLTVNPLNAPRPGTVGKPLPRVEIMIADDGEILAKGPNLMVGYYNKPDATAEVMRDGWFATGDIGRLDADGYLIITDRKKELLVTAGGKNVAPQPIEQKLKRHPLVAEAVLVGDGRPFIAVLIVPDFASLATHLGLPEDFDPAAIVDRPEVRSLFDGVVNEVNAGLAQFEQIKKVGLLPTEMSVATGELTPTLKVKRRVVTERWGSVIDQLFAEPVATEPPLAG